MFDILIVTHGTLAHALVESGALIAGQPENIKTLGLDLGIDLEEFRNNIEISIKNSIAKGELLVLTDLMFGTPFNCVSSLADRYNFQHFTGINLPIYLDIITSRKYSELPEICKMIKDSGKSSFVYINDMLEKEVEE